MKCRSCSANYSSSEAVCPFCGAANPLYETWSKETTAAKEALEKAKEEEASVDPLALPNRILNRLILIAILFIVLGSLFLELHFHFVQGAPGRYYRSHRAEMDAQMQTEYDEGRYADLYRTMVACGLTTDLTEETHKIWRQAAMLHQAYGYFNDKRFAFLSAEDPDDYPESDRKELTDSAVNLMRCKGYLLRDSAVIFPENEAYHTALCDDIRSFLTGCLDYTDEEVDEMIR